MFSLVIPLYKSESNLARLLHEVGEFSRQIATPLEVVFVVDGSPDRCAEILQERLPAWSVRSQLVELSRNFGSFAAIAAGLRVAKGEHFAILAADLQEPLSLIAEFHDILSAGRADVVFGYRTGRADPWWSQFLSNCFWVLYRRFVLPEMPAGGIDVFACNRRVRDELAQLPESTTNLVALLFWLGFRRAFVPYVRQPRLEGKSAWTFSRKLSYALDSIFNFTDLPVRALLLLGIVGITAAATASVFVFVMRLIGLIPVLGYTPLMLAVMFFGGTTALGLGIVGQYLWLTLANSRRRPPFVVSRILAFEPPEPAASRTS
jgi:glycosyltransferase involved in cell wall biosynthesis